MIEEELQWFQCHGIELAIQTHGCVVVRDVISAEQADKTLKENLVTPEKDWNDEIKTHKNRAKGIFGRASNQSSLCQLQNRQAPLVAHTFGVCYKTPMLIVNHGNVQFVPPASLAASFGTSNAALHIDVDPVNSRMRDIPGFESRNGMPLSVPWRDTVVLEGFIALSDELVFEIVSFNKPREQESLYEWAYTVSRPILLDSRRQYKLKKGSLVVWNALLHHRIISSDPSSTTWKAVQYVCMLPRSTAANLNIRPKHFELQNEQRTWKAVENYHHFVPTVLGMCLFDLLCEKAILAHLGRQAPNLDGAFCEEPACCEYALGRIGRWLCEKHLNTVPPVSPALTLAWE